MASVQQAVGTTGRPRKVSCHIEEFPNLLEAGETILLRSILLNILNRLDIAYPALRVENLSQYLADYGALIGLDPAMFQTETDSDQVLLRKLQGVRSALKALPSTPAAPTDMDQRVDWLVGTLALTPQERAILDILARVVIHDYWWDILYILPGRGLWVSTVRIGFMTGMNAAAIRELFLPNAPLARHGLLSDERDGDYSPGPFLRRIALMALPKADELTERMMPAAPHSTLEWSDFDHIGEMRELAYSALRASARQGRGFNLLLHGVPGTGKSEFARALVDKLNLKAVFVGLTGDNGGEPCRRERIGHLNVVRALSRNRHSNVIVVDEADDILTMMPDGERQGQSKLWLNRLIEEGEVPTIWIVNDPACLEGNTIRRMTMVIGFRLPPPSVRMRVLQRHAERSGLLMNGDMLREAASIPVAPAVLANAVDAVALTGGSGATIALAARCVLEAMEGKAPAYSPTLRHYEPTLACADMCLEKLSRQLVASQERNWSLLLSGPSGTGKSAYARYLARMLGIEIEERRGSDLLSPYVGGTEAKIAEAFQESAKAGAMLLIDEVDSFLINRRDAHHSWETSMANEMLRWMEAMPTPFVATTNLPETMDQASQRRFTLRVAFQALRTQQVGALFQRYFGQQAPDMLMGIEGLTPGDFGAVAKRAKLVGANDRTELAGWLIAEAEARGRSGRPVGFHRLHAA